MYCICTCSSHLLLVITITWISKVGVTELCWFIFLFVFSFGSSVVSIGISGVDGRWWAWLMMAMRVQMSLSGGSFKLRIACQEVLQLSHKCISWQHSEARVLKINYSFMKPCTRCATHVYDNNQTRPCWLTVAVGTCPRARTAADGVWFCVYCMMFMM